MCYDRITYFYWRLNAVKVCLCRPRLRPSRTKKCKRPHINATQQGLMTPYPGLHSLPLCFVRVQDWKFLHVAPKVHFDSDGEVHDCEPESTDTYDAVIWCSKNTRCGVNTVSLVFCVLVYIARFVHAPNTRHRKCLRFPYVLFLTKYFFIIIFINLI